MTDNKLKPQASITGKPRILPKEGSIHLLDILRDNRLNSLSFMVSLSVQSYLAIASSAYESKGRIEGQRDSLKTTSAVRIRNRMESDVQAGAVLPPLVIGILVNNDLLKEAEQWKTPDIVNFLSIVEERRISLIDGMQRTTALSTTEDLKDRQIRAEIWLVTATAHLTYRMLVLNTGQVPWSIRRQMEVVYRSLLVELESKLDIPDIQIFGLDDQRRRFNAGEYQASFIIEMYIAFGLRKERIDKIDVLSDQFSRLDMVEAVADEGFFGLFVEIFKLLVSLDRSFDRHRVKGDPLVVGEPRFNDGRSIFDTQAGTVGFVVACGKRLLGRPGAVAPDQLRQAEILKDLRSIVSIIADKTEHLSREDFRNFMALDTLSEAIMRPSGKIGDFERAFFLTAFDTLFTMNSTELTSLQACWRAY